VEEEDLDGLDGVYKSTGVVMVNYKWSEAYKAALLETDWTKMDERLQAIDEALQERKQEFALDHGGSPEENQAIDDAVRGLKVLRRDAATWRTQS